VFSFFFFKDRGPPKGNPFNGGGFVLHARLQVTGRSSWKAGSDSISLFVTPQAPEWEKKIDKKTSSGKHKDDQIKECSGDRRYSCKWQIRYAWTRLDLRVPRKAVLLSGLLLGGIGPLRVCYCARRASGVLIAGVLRLG